MPDFDDYDLTSISEDDEVLLAVSPEVPSLEKSLLFGPQGDLEEMSNYMRSPINKLPPEILGEIFLRCLRPRVWQPYSPEVKEAPMLLCQVCSYWRELALSIPMLWSSVCASMGERNRPGHVALMRQWLKRSCVQPLFLYLDIRRVDPLTSTMMNLLLDNVGRWSDVLFGVDDESAKDLLAIPGEDAQLLDSFSINAATCSQETVDELASILPTFPNLRRLRLYSFATPMALLGMEFSSLTHIKLLCPLPFNECVLFLARCPQIREVEITDITPSSTRLKWPIITLSHLSSLYVVSGVAELLDYFTLPALRLLSFGGIQLKNFQDFVTRSSCQLETFNLMTRGLSPSEEELIRYICMPCLKTIRELNIGIHSVTDKTLALLQYPVGSEAKPEDKRFPLLETLSIETCETTDGVVSDMVASRWQPAGGRRDENSPARLKGVLLRFEGKHEIDRSRLNEFAAGGLKVW